MPELRLKFKQYKMQQIPEDRENMVNIIRIYSNDDKSKLCPSGQFNFLSITMGVNMRGNCCCVRLQMASQVLNRHVTLNMSTHPLHAFDALLSDALTFRDRSKR